MAEPLPALAHRDLLGIARRADRVRPVLELCLEREKGFAALSALGGTNELRHTACPRESLHPAKTTYPQVSLRSLVSPALEIGHFCIKSESEVGQTIAFCRLSLAGFQPASGDWPFAPQSSLAGAGVDAKLAP